MTDLLTGSGEGQVFAAATVVLLRDGCPAYECLMLRKTKGQASGGVGVPRRAGRGCRRQRPRRRPPAAVREAEEETGLRLDVADLVPLSHWSPPATGAPRFATWFFVGSMPDGASEVVVDGGEIGDHVWTTPDRDGGPGPRARSRCCRPRGCRCTIVRPPRRGRGARGGRGRPAEHYLTRIVGLGDGVLVSLWHPDAAYPASVRRPGPLDAPGPRHRLYMDPAGWRYERSGGDHERGEHA